MCQNHTFQVGKNCKNPSPKNEKILRVVWYTYGLGFEMIAN